MSHQPPLPGQASNFINVALGVVSNERAVMFAEIGPGGTGTAGQLIRITSESQGRGLLGSSQGSEALGTFFATPQLVSTIELYVYTQDSTGWTVNTTDVTFGGTTTAAGEDIFRLGPHTVVVSQAKGADPTVQRDAFITAITDAAIPFTAAAAIAVDEVLVTSVHVGAAAGRTPITVNLRPERAETGVAGATPPIIVNNADATGVPAALIQADLDKIRVVISQYWIANTAIGAWIDGIDTALQLGWGPPGLNQYTWYMQSFATALLATFTGLISARNDRVISVFAQENAPHYELEVGVRLLATVINARDRDGRANPGLVEESIFGMQPGTLAFEPPGFATGPVNDAGGMSHHSSAGAAICPAFRAIRSQNDLAATDFTELYVSAILARRRILEAVGDVQRSHIGDLRRPDGEPLGKRNVSAQSMRDEISTTLQQLALDGQIFATQEEAAALVESVLPIVTANIVTGFKTTYNGQVTQPTVRHEAALQAT